MEGRSVAEFFAVDPPKVPRPGKTRSAGFGVAIDFDANPVVVAVRGEVDLCTGPELRSVLNAVIGQSHSSVVLDLAQMTFIDASGLGVLVHASALLQPSGGTLVLRSPPAMTRRILDITGVGNIVRVELPKPGAETVGPEQHSDSPDLSAGLTRSLAIRATDEVIDAALRLVVTLARATVDGANGVSVSLERRGELTTVAASDETIAQMDRDQYATGQGPCLAAASEGRWFYVESLAEETRWPDFVPLAIGGGIGSILSTPLMAAARPVGALNIYSTGERVFGAHERNVAALFATQASRILTDTKFEVPADEVAIRLRGALDAREVIAQAQGVVMEREGVSADEAYTVLRHAANREESSVRRTAVEVVASTRPAMRPSP
jgi:anti-anti-sigma factor